MKKLLFVLCVCASTLVKAQVDSSALTTTVSIQARDLEYITFFTQGFGVQLEDIYDKAKKQFRVAVPPSGTTSVILDSITLNDCIILNNILRTDYIALQYNIYKRYNDMLRILGQSYLVTQLDIIVAQDDALLADRKTLGRKRLKKQ